jgi:hypothetical protein
MGRPASRIIVWIKTKRPKPHGLGFEFPAFDFGQEGEADLLQAVVVGPGLLSARAFGGLLQQDLAVGIVQLGGGEFKGICQGMDLGIA